jgi:hypothetical protein
VSWSTAVGFRSGVVAGMFLLLVLPVAAQQETTGGARADTGSELAQLREASEYESAGNLQAAAEIIEGVLRDNPASLTALLAYERLLNVQGRIAEVLPAVDRLLAAHPASVLGHQVRLRVVDRLNDVAGIDATAAAWIRATPTVETPYREAALVWRQRGESARAIAVLEQGRKRIDSADALALELGDAFAAAGDMRRAAAEWARAVGADGRGFLLVQRRLQAQPDAGANAIPLLVEQLGDEPATPGRQRAAALFAIDAGLEPRAHRLASEITARSSAQEREQLLIELARRADGAGLYRLAAWSYGELLRGMRQDGAALAVRTRLAELALLAGDTALAHSVYRQLESAAATGSPQRREALALRLHITIRDGELTAAAEQLDTFRVEFPRAPELDETAARLATRYMDAGDVAGAQRVLSGVAGPHASRVRGRLYIRSGDLARAREELMAAAPLLQGREATETIALVALLTRVSPAGGELVARAVAADIDDRYEILGDALAHTAGFSAMERAAVLDFLAGIADASGLPDDADRLRSEIVASLPRSHEAPAAMLALARRSLERSHRRERDNTDEARVLLEKLILEHPRSALAPQARRELERLQSRGSSP